MRWRSVLLEGLAAEFAPRLLRFFASLGAEPGTAEDLAQEVFLKLLRTNAPYEEKGRLSAYVFRMAYRTWIDETRVRRPLPLPDEAAGSESRLDPGDGPLGELLRHESENSLQGALWQLPPEQRAVFELGVIQGLRYREIAEIFGIPLGTVKSRVFAAACKLKKLLEEKAPIIRR